MNYTAFHKVILGQEVTINWQVKDSSVRRLLVYRPQSFWFWNNFSIVRNNGEYSAKVTSKNFSCSFYKIRYFWPIFFFKYQPDVLICEIKQESIGLRGHSITQLSRGMKANYVKPFCCPKKLSIQSKIPFIYLNQQFIDVNKSI
jgi:hypothetical protein